MTAARDDLSTAGNDPGTAESALAAHLAADSPDTEFLPKAARMSRAELDALPAANLELLGIAALAGPANVIMQLALPAVGYGVYESRVDSGNLFKHPLKRTRTTLSYLAVASCDDPRCARHIVVRSAAPTPRSARLRRVR